VPSFKINFLGVTILQGVEFSIFPIDFEWALQQCSATALPVMLSTPFRHISEKSRKTQNLGKRQNAQLS